MAKRMKRRKPRACPKTRKHASLRSALACLVRRRKGRPTKATAKLHKKARKLLRKSKWGRAALRRHGL